MKTFNKKQMTIISNLSNKFGFDIVIIQPDSIACTIDNMIIPVDYLSREFKGTGIKMVLNIADRCFCLYV